MSISFAAALAGTVLAAVGTGLAIRLCLRKPRADMVAWVIALAGLTVGLAAQAAGYRRGFIDGQALVYIPKTQVVVDVFATFGSR